MTPERLTEREQRVVELAAEGMTDFEIGEQMHIVSRTVSRHIESACGKLGARNRTHLVATALRQGVIQ